MFIALLLLFSKLKDRLSDPKLLPEFATFMASRNRFDLPMEGRPPPLALRREYLAESMPVRAEMPLIPLNVLSLPTSLISALFPIVEEIGSEIPLRVLIVFPPPLNAEVAGS